MKKPLAITMGDPGGIGPEIVLKCFLKGFENPLNQGVMATSFVLGDLRHLERARLCLGSSGERLRLCPIERVQDALLQTFSAPSSEGLRNIPVLEVALEDEAVRAFLGPEQRKVSSSPLSHNSATAPLAQTSAFAGSVSASNIFCGARAALRGEVSALVTAPIHKQSLALAGIDFPGHTEMLQFAAAKHANVPVSEMSVRMMLASPELRVVLVSIHVSLRQAIERVSAENILETLKITHASLTPVLGRPPKIAGAGLNPHCGEGGLMGREELEIIAPCIHQAQSTFKDMVVSGPYAPDTVFMQARTGRFDVVIAMYHDQGLIPIKYMGLDQGVNVTLGLPMVRTSPDHGTAYEIAGRGLADPSSMWAAIELAQVLSAQT